jgi:hypothetical protein
MVRHDNSCRKSRKQQRVSSNKWFLEKGKISTPPGNKLIRGQENNRCNVAPSTSLSRQPNHHDLAVAKKYGISSHGRKGFGTDD